MFKKMKDCRMDFAVALVISLCASVVGLSGGMAFAQEAKAPEPPKKWETIASAGVALTRGNSESLLANLGIDSVRKWPVDEVLLGAKAGYGENTDPQTEVFTKTDQYVKGYGQYNHLFTERFYGGVRLDGIYDEVAGIQYRFVVTPMVGYYLVKNATTFLAVEAGPAGVYEKLKGQDSEFYVALRIAERFEHKFNERTKVWQMAEYLPQVDRFSNYTLNFEAGISTAMSSHLDLRMVFSDSYRNEPSFGRKRNDLKLIAGIGYKF